MPRKEQGWITFQASEEERQLLDKLSTKLHRTKTEILRELVRGLQQHYMRSPQSIPTQKQQKEDGTTDFIQITNSPKNLKISSHNILPGIVTELIRTEISSQITIKILQEVELTSIIPTDSIDELELHEGTEAYAMINFNNIVIAKENSSVVSTDNQKTAMEFNH